MSHAHNPDSGVITARTPRTPKPCNTIGRCLVLRVEQSMDEGSARRALKKIFSGIIDAGGMQAHPETQRDMVQDVAQDLHQRLTEAVGDGELSESADVAALSSLAAILSVGFAQCTHAGLAKEDLQRAVEIAVDHFGFQQEPAALLRRRRKIH